MQDPVMSAGHQADRCEKVAGCNKLAIMPAEGVIDKYGSATIWGNNEIDTVPRDPVAPTI